MNMMRHTPHMQHLNQMPPQTGSHHMQNMNQHQQHMNMSTQQPHNHMIHNHQNYHQRSNSQHNHHSQRMNYGQNRPSFHNGSHNMHSNHGPNNVAAMSSNVSQPQQSANINKIDSNCGVQQSNPQPRYKTMDASNLGNQHHVTQKPSIQVTANSENVRNIDLNELNRDCANDQSALNAIATSAKIKTPMCLVNELVRAHQLKHQYRITDEKGPSHDKHYTVLLELGDERYTGQSKTIKGAQQAAAAVALEKTNYKQPTSRRLSPRVKYGNLVTPTVQLNALAMKRGVPTNYSYQLPQSHNELLNIARNARIKGNKMRFRDKFLNSRSSQHVLRTTEDDPFRVTVAIGDKQFSGIGLTMQSAKHDAAAKALAELKDEPTKPLQSTVVSFEAADKVVHGNGDIADESNADPSKSAISVVQEIAQKRDLPIRFVVESETGPAHMKHFIIKCSVGETETTGDGNSKKVAKKHAAENMLNELKKLPPLRALNDSQGRRKFGGKRNASTNSRQQVQQDNARRKGATVNKDLNKSTESAIEENELSNPISKLLRMQQAAKQNEPVYTVVDERGQGRRKEFVIEVSCSGLTGRGVGNSKKIAKREAAKNILAQLSCSETDATVTQNANVTEKHRKVTFSEPRVYSDKVGQSGGAAGRQLVPGILLMKSPENNRKTKNANQSGINYTTTATIAKELLDGGKSATAETIISQTSPVKKAPTEEIKVEVSPSKIEPNNNNIGETKKSHGILATEQLLYLADLLHFEVQFDDFPRGNHNDFLTLASLNTDPPQMFHGTGNSAEASKNQAALAALKALSELSLDNVNKPKTKSIISNGKSN